MENKNVNADSYARRCYDCECYLRGIVLEVHGLGALVQSGLGAALDDDVLEYSLNDMGRLMNELRERVDKIVSTGRDILQDVRTRHAYDVQSECQTERRKSRVVARDRLGSLCTPLIAELTEEQRNNPLVAVQLSNRGLKGTQNNTR